MVLENGNLEWRLVRNCETQASVEQFWAAIDIYIKKSHVINRRLIGCEILGTYNVNDDQELKKMKNVLFSCGSSKNMMEVINNAIETNEAHDQTIIVKKVLPKSSALKESIEIVVKDYEKARVSFFNGVSKENTNVPYFPYAFSYDGKELGVWVEEKIEDSDPSLQWVVSKLTAKLVKWMATMEQSTDSGSLRLVPVSEYSSLYNQLKETYGKQLVEVWPENTDPLKFVYEDIGIAAYLLLLWAGKPKQRFVDLGCGNGLLVHILNSEGHLGVGYDLKARKIWSMYPPSTKLEVCAIIPSADSVFPDTDWLIGNHSDELTVWIPVMAARSSYSCNFFLLPCCPYNFDGSKYCRLNTSVSHYSDFLSYVETVCGECGIITDRDKLRIPSTKRTCFVGKNRSYPEREMKVNLEKLEQFLRTKGAHTVGESWCPQFKPRGEERVRNCTQINSEIRESIINLVTQQLLSKKRISAEGWNLGGIVEIGTIAKMIPSEKLKQLKKECGGLQTLLKNYHPIFKVEGGKVQFRMPIEKERTDSNVWKTKPCWFFHNHPDSCPLANDKCSFLH